MLLMLLLLLLLMLLLFLLLLCCSKRLTLLSGMSCVKSHLSNNKIWSEIWIWFWCKFSSKSKRIGFFFSECFFDWDWKEGNNAIRSHVWEWGMKPIWRCKNKAENWKPKNKNSGNIGIGKILKYLSERTGDNPIKNIFVLKRLKFLLLLQLGYCTVMI